MTGAMLATSDARDQTPLPTRAMPDGHKLCEARCYHMSHRNTQHSYLLTLAYPDLPSVIGSPFQSAPRLSCHELVAQYAMVCNFHRPRPHPTQVTASSLGVSGPRTHAATLARGQGYVVSTTSFVSGERAGLYEELLGHTPWLQRVGAGAGAGAGSTATWSGPGAGAGAGSGQGRDSPLQPASSLAQLQHDQHYHHELIQQGVAGGGAGRGGGTMAAQEEEGDMGAERRQGFAPQMCVSGGGGGVVLTVDGAGAATARAGRDVAATGGLRAASYPYPLPPALLCPSPREPGPTNAISPAACLGNSPPARHAHSHGPAPTQGHYLHCDPPMPSCLAPAASAVAAVYGSNGRIPDLRSRTGSGDCFGPSAAAAASHHMAAPPAPCGSKDVLSPSASGPGLYASASTSSLPTWAASAVATAVPCSPSRLYPPLDGPHSVSLPSVVGPASPSAAAAAAAGGTGSTRLVLRKPAPVLRLPVVLAAQAAQLQAHYKVSTSVASPGAMMAAERAQRYLAASIAADKGAFAGARGYDRSSLDGAPSLPSVVRPLSYPVDTAVGCGGTVGHVVRSHSPDPLYNARRGDVGGRGAGVLPPAGRGVMAPR